ncbi:zinc-ribbon domain-containing protein [Desulfobacter postgatei]|jgi:hypothetical protein|uniref:zinc ribbon domain-containing protein n=1 Tax=Desulfobacter postgatei TaxID=2293 RepID=UPI00387E0881
MFCTKCKKEIEDNSKFCEFCGSNINRNYIELVDQVLKLDSLSELEKLNKKMWYRSLKVIYFLVIISYIIVSFNFAIIEENSIRGFIILVLIILIIAEIIKRSFYYIYLGKIFPKKLQSK